MLDDDEEDLAGLCLRGYEEFSTVPEARIHSLGLNGEGTLRGQPTNLGSLDNMAVKTV